MCVGQHEADAVQVFEPMPDKLSHLRTVIDDVCANTISGIEPFMPSKAGFLVNNNKIAVLAPKLLPIAT
jgi:hypothetical protein